MTQPRSPNVEVVDLAPGLWIWRLEHPSWSERHDWQQVVTSVCVDAGDERWVIDPLLPPQDVTQVWDRFAERSPTAMAVLLGDHLRETWTDRRAWSNDALARLYGCRNFGPNAFDPDMIEEVGGVRDDGRGSGRDRRGAWLGSLAHRRHGRHSTASTPVPLPAAHAAGARGAGRSRSPQ